MNIKPLYAAFVGAAALVSASAQNPYMPLWEHIPDGEPYVFEDPDRPGHQRVYVYGSHDNLRTMYCGRDQVVWSAPVDDLSAWRYDGVIFKSQLAADGKQLDDKGLCDVLFAPDVVETEENGQKVYYLCPNNQAGGRQNMIAKSHRPDGPFEVCNWNQDGRTTFGLFGFDPAIFRDDDGRVYGYWGFESSNGAELDPTTMCTLKPGTQVVSDMVSSCKQQGVFRFFEASSIRKVKGMYVFVYSRMSADGEFGLPSTNYTLAYAYSDKPLGPWTYGGTIIDARARDTDENGKTIPTAWSAGNTHGSILEINGQWYVFYHRQTGTNEYSRQAMVAPIDVKVEGGKVMIGEAEYTSEGFRTQGLDPLARTPAGLACYLTAAKPMRHEYPNNYFSGSYIAATYPEADFLDASYSLNVPHSPVINNTDGSTVGYKYFNFDEAAKRGSLTLDLHLKPLGAEGEIVVMTDSPWESKGGKKIGSVRLDGSANGFPTHITTTVSGLKGGKHALYFLFKSPTKGKSLCDFYDFIFR